MWWALVKVSLYLSDPSNLSIPMKDQFVKKSDCITEMEKRNAKAKGPAYMCIPLDLD